MATPARPDPRAGVGLNVILLVAAVDRRILPALRFVSQLREAQARAFHVSMDPELANHVATDWMKLDLSFLPLHIREAEEPTLALSVKALLRAEVSELGSLTAVLPEFEYPRWWHALLHRQSARSLAVELQELRGVTPVIVPFSAPRPPMPFANTPRGVRA